VVKYFYIMKENSDNLARWINRQAEDKNLSFREIAKRGGISVASVSDAASGQSVGFKVCKGLAKAFDVSEEKVLRLAGLLPPQPKETPTSRELLYMFMQLDNQDQERILSITRTFLEEKKGRVITGGEKPATA
jgi:transcriptional regulator with XRE-family HTH domain